MGEREKQALLRAWKTLQTYGRRRYIYGHRGWLELIFKLDRGRPRSSGQAQDEPGYSGDAPRKRSNSDGQSSVKFYGHANYTPIDTTSIMDIHRTVAIKVAKLSQDAQNSKALSAHLDRLKDHDVWFPQGLVLGPTLWNVAYDGLLSMEVPPGIHLVGFVAGSRRGPSKRDV